MTRHETDYFSLAAGLLFVTLGLVFLISSLVDWSIDGRWVVPVMLIALGAGGVAASLSATRREEAAYAQRLTQAEDTPGGSGSLPA